VAALVADERPRAAPGSAPSTRPGPASGSVIIERARKYLATIPPAVSGQGGHAQTLLAAEHLVRGFSLSDDDALALLSEWNQHCEPPWTESELRHKLTEARSKGTAVAVGAHLQDDRPTRHDATGPSWQSITGDTVAPPPLPPLPEIISLPDLARDHSRMRPVLIDGLLRRGETANIIANPKVGKSWLTYGLALSVATGRQWLDTFATMRGRVLLADNELHQPTLAHRIPTVADAMEIGRDQYASRIDVLSLRGRLMDIMALSRLVETIPENQYSLIVVDAWYRMLPGGISENDNGAMAAVFNRVDQYAAQTGAAWCLIHHASKGNQTEKRVTDVGAGAGSQSRAADSHIVLREHEEPGHVVMDAAVRSFAPIRPLTLRWEFPVWRPADHVDPTRLADAKKTQQSNRDNEGRRAILSALKTDGPSTGRKLRSLTGMGPQRLDRLIDRLAAEGQVVVDEILISGQSAHQYRLALPEEMHIGPAE